LAQIKEEEAQYKQKIYKLVDFAIEKDEFVYQTKNLWKNKKWIFCRKVEAHLIPKVKRVQARYNFLQINALNVITFMKQSLL